MAAQRLQDQRRVLLIGLVSLLLTGSRDLGRRQHVTSETGSRQLVVQPKPQPRGFVGEDHRRSACRGRPRVQQLPQLQPPGFAVGQREFFAVPRPWAINNIIVRSCKSQATMIDSAMASAPVLEGKGSYPNT